MAVERKKNPIFHPDVIFGASNASMLRTDSPRKCIKCKDELNSESKYSKEKNTKQVGRMPYKISIYL